MTPVFKIFMDSQGAWQWQLRAADGQVMATCGQGFTDQQSCLKSVDFVRTVAPLAQADILDSPGTNEMDGGEFLGRQLT
ncbi:YegP family protein [Ottowia thiooxydans]|uniref:Uncharacterized protein YegP (UPF0339 family) n=1 Tax=Ottowia thiooxydans TaxID=219182 RepID=A0ABV2Q6S8_9BURK